MLARSRPSLSGVEEGLEDLVIRKSVRGKDVARKLVVGALAHPGRRCVGCSINQSGAVVETTKSNSASVPPHAATRARRRAGRRVDELDVRGTLGRQDRIQIETVELGQDVGRRRRSGQRSGMDG